MSSHTIFCEAQNRTFELDPESSVISFSVSHLGFLTVEGTFGEFSATCEIRTNTIAFIHGQINVGSIETGDRTRDRSLKSDAYLDSASYPLIQFESTGIKRTSNETIVTGKLKIKDQERFIAIPIQYSLSQDKMNCSVNAKTIINRKDFHLDFGAMDALIGEEITVDLDLSFRIN